MLSRLAPTLPGFSRDNWQSTIRHYVNVHEDYANLAPWNGRETADILYADRDGIFTALLVDMGYLHADTWVGRRPTYYLEVKTTTTSWETPFYMSKYQYERVRQSMSLVVLFACQKLTIKRTSYRNFPAERLGAGR